MTVYIKLSIPIQFSGTERAKWNHIFRLHEVDSQSDLRLCPKLTTDHFILPFGKKMRVSMAIEVLSNSVSAALKTYAASNQLPDDVLATAKFVQKVDCLWNYVNCRTFKPENVDDISYFDDSRKWIEKWVFVSDHGQVKDTLPFKKCFLITLASLSALFRELLLLRGHQKLSSRRCNQDSLENTFAEIRHDRGGFDSNPEVSKAIDNLRIASSANLMAKKTANCENSHEYLFLGAGKLMALRP